MAISGIIELNNMAENISFFATEKPKLGRGRRTEIQDEILWGVRDSLLGILEATWMDVGDKLPQIKTPADVLAALGIWERDNFHNRQYVTQILLRPSSSPATSKSLNDKRRRCRALNESAQSAHESMEKCYRSFEPALRISTTQYSESEREVIDEKIRERARALAHAGAEYIAIKARQKDMDRELQDCEAHFARAEFVRFCRNNRYRLTTLHTANALAGLPYMGWRRSIQRCRTEKPASSNGGTIQVFNTIKRIVQSCPRKSGLIKHAEKYLRNPVRVGSNSYGVSELQQKWFYLRWSIKTVLETGMRTRDLPFAIAREYDKRKNHPSNVDLLFEGEERIVS